MKWLRRLSGAEIENLELGCSTLQFAKF